MPTDAIEVLDEHWESIQESGRSTDPEQLPYFERLEFWREQIPDGYMETYETLTGRGCTTRVAVAVCQYFAGHHDDAPTVSQAEVAARFDISPSSIKRWSQELSTTPGEH